MTNGGFTSLASRVRQWLAMSAAAALSLALVGGHRQAVEAKPVVDQSAAAREKAAVVKFTEPPEVQSEPSLAAFVVHADQPAATELLHDLPVPPAPASLVPAAAETAIRVKRATVIRMQVTAYCACKKCCGPRAQGLTASGRHVSYNGGHFVAADTSLFPFGTKISIPGYANGEPVEVIDRGGAIKGYHLDIFLPTHEQAAAWGKQWIQVTVER